MAKKTKPVTAQELLNFLEELKASGQDLKKITLNFRPNRDSDVTQVKVVEEDLYDAKTNNKLESIIFIADPREV